MNYTVDVRHAAERDVLAAQAWYEQQQTGLAKRFFEEFSDAIERLEADPLICQIVYRDVRRAVLRRFPFLIWYRVVGQRVIVLACTHGRQRPSHVARRLKG